MAGRPDAGVPKLGLRSLLAVPAQRRRVPLEPPARLPDLSGKLTVHLPGKLTKGREKWYESVDEIQADLDVFIAFYNLKRSHQGYRLKGRTPAQALRDALGSKKLPPIIPKEDENAVTEAA